MGKVGVMESLIETMSQRGKSRCLLTGAILAGLIMAPLVAQELEPGAYSPSPIGFDIIAVAGTSSSGDLNFDSSSAIEDAEANINNAALGYVRTLGVNGRQASIGAVVPYLKGKLEGSVAGEPREAVRSGWGDPRLRFTYNLVGVPALSPRDFAQHRTDRTLGATFVVIPPLGQYDSSKVINLGTNRWSFKSEIGGTRSFGRWTYEASAGIWAFTDNTDYNNGGTREQNPIGIFQAHVRYTIKPRMWVGLSANFYNGGRTTVNQTENADLQQNSRVGLTFALPVDQRQSVKFFYSKGARTTLGADFDLIGISYQIVSNRNR